MRVFLTDGVGSAPREGYGRPGAGGGTLGGAGPGCLTGRAHTAASRAKGTTTPSVKGMVEGRMAALSAGTTVYRAKAPSWGRPLVRLMACLCVMLMLEDCFMLSFDEGQKS